MATKTFPTLRLARTDAPDTSPDDTSSNEVDESTSSPLKFTGSQSDLSFQDADVANGERSSTAVLTPSSRSATVGGRSGGRFDSLSLGDPGPDRRAAAARRGADWPPEVDLIISAIETGRGLAIRDRRATSRQSYRTLAVLRLFSDLEDTDPWQLYTRDIDNRGIGFITRHRLPLGYGGLIRFDLPDGREVEAHCTLLRCREAAPGWFEGALYFNREQDLGL